MEDLLKHTKGTHPDYSKLNGNYSDGEYVLFICILYSIIHLTCTNVWESRGKQFIKRYIFYYKSCKNPHQYYKSCENLYQYSKSRENLPLSLCLFVAASAQIAAVASHINEHIRQHENFKKMLAIQNSLTGQCVPGILSPGRRFLQEGRLMKVQGNHIYKTRWELCVGTRYDGIL